MPKPWAGPSIQTMRQLAIDHEVVLICPMFEAGEEQRFYNSAIVIDAGGEILGSYRKVHVPQIPLWEERFYFAPGNLGFPVFKTKFGVIGIQICWDNFFPEGSRILSLKGAQIIFSPTAAAFASQKKWETVITGNAIIERGLYLQGQSRREGRKTGFLWDVLLCLAGRRIIRATDRDERRDCPDRY